ncbi:hypothetical protein DY102_05105 [Apilactobacillus timberlakei]|uniref:hypothetical protein n=1 Tax=Apilactobacillus timberlakei TaxID=2008380 RepID=UPI00112A969F|nr:hypothetical protein [Apilactobacillus timberlakei]TPR23422.1 hypothetical protein DY102_05105 [Apilactobacillus timberlakei]
MNKNLKKSLYVGIAALSLLTLSNLNVNAKGKATAAHHQTKQVQKHVKKTTNNKVTAEYSPLKVSTDNAYVKSTGIVTMFNKPGKLGNAKVVASKTTMKKLAKSNSPKDIFYVYEMAKTNNGLYYAKVVTLGGKYRGWIYAGKTDFANDLTKIDKGTGITAKNPLQYAKMPKNKTGYHVTSSLWTTPNYSRINSKVLDFNKKEYAKDTFRIESAVANTQGWVYYYVVDEQHPKINGWAFHSSVKGKHANTKKRAPAKKAPVKKESKKNNKQKNDQPKIDNNDDITDGKTPTTSNDQPKQTNGYTLKFVNQATAQVVSQQTVGVNDLTNTTNPYPAANTSTVAKYLPKGYGFYQYGNAVASSGGVSNGGQAVIYVAKNPSINSVKLNLRIFDNTGAANPVNMNSNGTNGILNAQQELVDMNIMQGSVVTTAQIQKVLADNGLTVVPGNNGSANFAYTDAGLVQGSNPVINVYYR